MISVIIPARDDAQHLQHCLSLLAQQQGAPEHEILVVASDAASARVARAHGTRVLSPEQPMTPGAARNLARGAARGEYLAYLDARCAPPAEWLARVADLAGPQAVGGARRLAPGSGAWGRVQFLLEFCEFLQSTKAGPKRFVPAGNMVLPRALAKEFPFDESAYAAEDVAIGRCLQAAGQPVVFAPQLYVDYVPRQGARPVLRHLLRRGEASARTRRRLNLAGAQLQHWPTLAWMLLPWRAALIAGRVARRELHGALWVLALAPLMLAGLAFWTRGFRRGISPFSSAETS
jgi:glycosyltransferase involved in cell wall biosynthesis